MARRSTHFSFSAFLLTLACFPLPCVCAEVSVPVSDSKGQKLPPLSEITLSNGDHLKARILSQSDGKLLLQSELLGKLLIPESAIASINGDFPPVALTALGLASSALTATTSQPSLLWRILKASKGSLEFGFQDSFGRRSSQSLNLRGDGEYIRGLDSFKASGRYYYGNYDNAVSDDRFDAALRYRRDLNASYFLQASSSYFTDHVKEITDNIELSAGGGWNAFSRPRQSLKMGGGLMARQRRVYGNDSGIMTLADFFQEYTFKLNDRLSILQYSSIQYSPVDRALYVMVNNELQPANDNAANFKVSFNTALKGKLSNRLSLNLRFEYEFDNTISNVSLKSDRRISSTLGYLF